MEAGLPVVEPSSSMDGSLPALGGEDGWVSTGQGSGRVEAGLPVVQPSSSIDTSHPELGADGSSLLTANKQGRHVAEWIW